MLIGSAAGAGAVSTALVMAVAGAAAAGVLWAVWRMTVRMGARPVRVRAEEHAAPTLEQRRARGQLSVEDYRRLRAMADRAGVSERGRR